MGVRAIGRCDGVDGQVRRRHLHVAGDIEADGLSLDPLMLAHQAQPSARAVLGEGGRLGRCPMRCAGRWPGTHIRPGRRVAAPLR